MAKTYLGMPFDEDIFTGMWQDEPDPVRTALLEAGVMVADSAIASQIQGNGVLYTIPFYNELGGNVVNYDGATDITATETGGGYQTGVVYGRAAGWSARDFVAELSGADPMGNISRKVGRFWQKDRQARLVKLLDTLFSITKTGKFGHDWADHTLTKTTGIAETDLNDLATQACGDQKGAFAVAIMHSAVARKLESKQLLEFWKQTDPNGLQRPVNLASCNGYTVIVDDSMPFEKGTGAEEGTTKYTTYLLGTGVIRQASARLDHPSETHRDPAKNGGTDYLYTKIRETIHPNGFSFSAPSANFTNSPTDDQLFNKANWSLQFDPKAIPMDKLVTVE